MKPLPLTEQPAFALFLKYFSVTWMGVVRGVGRNLLRGGSENVILQFLRDSRGEDLLFWKSIISELYQETYLLPVSVQ